MPKFVKKPVEIEAYQWSYQPRQEDAKDTPRFIVDALKSDMITLSDGAWYVQTLETGGHAPVHLISDGDWIICGVKGELYPCKPDIFEATYNPVD